MSTCEVREFLHEIRNWKSLFPKLCIFLNWTGVVPKLCIAVHSLGEKKFFTSETFLKLCFSQAMRSLGKNIFHVSSARWSKLTSGFKISARWCSATSSCWPTSSRPSPGTTRKSQSTPSWWETLSSLGPSKSTTWELLGPCQAGSVNKWHYVYLDYHL